jgi:hypothetical protein
LGLFGYPNRLGISFDPYFCFPFNHRIADDERMRRFFRWFMPSFTAGLVLAFGNIFGTVFRQNIEVLAEEYGAHAYLLEGWRIITDLGLESWLLYGIFFSSGASVALWVDYWLRRWSERQAIEAGAELLNARALVGWDTEGNLLPVSNMDNAHHVYAQPWLDRVMIMIGFTAPIMEGHIQVASNIKGLKWKECAMSDRHAVIGAEGNLKGGIIHVEVVPPLAASGRRQQEGLWQDAIHFDDMSYFQQGAV